MAQPIQSTLDILLLSIQTQLMAVLGWEVERVIIDTENDEDDETKYQAEQIVFIRRASSALDVGWVGAGRVWAPERAMIACTLWTRCALDESPGFASGLTDPLLGHEVYAAQIRDALYAFQPVDSSGNWLVQEPLAPASGIGPKRRKKLDTTWTRSVISVSMIYANSLNQAYQ